MNWKAVVVLLLSPILIVTCLAVALLLAVAFYVKISYELLKLAVGAISWAIAWVSGQPIVITDRTGHVRGVLRWRTFTPIDVLVKRSRVHVPR